MQVTFKPTNYKFQFNDTYFVQLKYTKESTRVSLRLCEEMPHVACFSELEDAKEFIKNKMTSNPDVCFGWVFTRDKQVWTFGKWLRQLD